MQLTVEIPEEMKFAIKRIAKERGFTEVSDYVLQVIADAFVAEFAEFGLLELFHKHDKKTTLD